MNNATTGCSGRTVLLVDPKKRKVIARTVTDENGYWRLSSPKRRCFVVFA